MTGTEQVNTPAKKLLNPAQVKRCKAIAAAENDYSARANALLALHSGNSQIQTATQVGLTIGQVRYWVARFRQLGMDAFPAAANGKSAPAAAITKEVIVKEPAKKVKKKDKKDKKKTKADKVKKKDKKSNSDKSAKKDKKKTKEKKKAKNSRK